MSARAWRARRNKTVVGSVILTFAPFGGRSTITRIDSRADWARWRKLRRIERRRRVAQR